MSSNRSRSRISADAHRPSSEATRADRSGSRPTSDVVRVGVIGYGYWGPNIVRNFHGLDDCEVVAVCDKSPAALSARARAYPGVAADDRLRRGPAARPTSTRSP